MNSLPDPVYHKDTESDSCRLQVCSFDYETTFQEGEKEGEEDAEVSFGADESGEKSGEKEAAEDQEPGDDDVMTIDDDEDEPEKWQGTME